MRTLAVLVLITSSAAAETTVSLDEAPREAKRETAVPAFRFGEMTKGATIDNVALAMQTGPADVRVIASFTLATTAKVPQDTLLVLDVPVGAQVTYLGMELAGERRIAQLVDGAGARVDYERIVRGVQDPALLEWVGTTPASERLRLRVFPMQRGQSAHVELIMTVPATEKLAISPGTRVMSRVRVEVDGTKTTWSKLGEVRAIALSDQIVAARPAVVPHVDATQSLFIGAPTFWQPEERVAPEPVVHRGAVVIAEECLRNPIAPSCM